MPPTLQTESVAKPVAVFWISRLEQISLDIGENAVLISLSVVASVQCCIVTSGNAELTRAIFISHRPGLRSGISAAPKPGAGSTASRQVPRQNDKSGRVMLGSRRFPVSTGGMVRF